MTPILTHGGEWPRLRATLYYAPERGGGGVYSDKRCLCRQLLFIVAGVLADGEANRNVVVWHHTARCCGCNGMNEPH